MVAQVQNKSGRLAGKLESRWEPLYDTITLSGTITSFRQRFFATAISASKTENETNLVKNASLPSPQSFLVFGLNMNACVYLNNVAHAADLNFLQKLAKDSYVRFFVGTKDYFTVTLASIVGGITEHSSNGDITGAGAQRVNAQLNKPSHYGYRLPKDQYIPINSDENFGVEWVCDTASITLNNAVSFKLYLDGLRTVDVR